MPSARQLFPVWITGTFHIISTNTHCLVTVQQKVKEKFSPARDVLGSLTAQNELLLPVPCDAKMALMTSRSRQSTRSLAAMFKLHDASHAGMFYVFEESITVVTSHQQNQAVVLLVLE